MIYRKFGKTGLDMPVVSCGLMRSMFSWKDTPEDAIPMAQQNNLARVVEAAFANGITHLETARGYGSSERQLATILSDYSRDSYILQTKVHPEDDPDVFTENVLDSLQRMGQKRVDLLALHGINDYHSLWQSCRPGGCLAAARRLQACGRVGFVGFSGHGSLKVILSAIQHEGDGGFDYLNIHWYAIWQQNYPALLAAKKRNLGIFIISPTDKGGMLQQPPQKLIQASKPLDPIQFNDLFCLQGTGVHTIAVGASCPDDFTTHCAVLDRLNNTELVESIYGRWEKLMERHCGMKKPDAIWHLLPCWQETPGYMNLPYIFWLYNLACGWDLQEYASARYEKLGLDMPWVAGNNAAIAGQFDLSSIAEMTGMAATAFQELLTKAHALLGKSDWQFSEKDLLGSE